MIISRSSAMLEAEHVDPKAPLAEQQQLAEWQQQVPEWETSEDGKVLTRRFAVRDFHQTIGLASAIAWLANREDHHPDMELSYKRCAVHFTTHSAGGLTRNDFILAAKVDALFR
jgi:4a-hydroxytetrahydrobiopterin dehydratase